MTKMRAVLLMLVLGFVGASSVTAASVVSGLCNTGYTDGGGCGTLISTSPTTDGNWTVTSTADLTAKQIPVTANYPGWYTCADAGTPSGCTNQYGTATADWITTLTSSGVPDTAVGLYIYQEKITTGNSGGILTISGDYDVDNCATIAWSSTPSDSSPPAVTGAGAVGTTLGGGVSNCTASQLTFDKPPSTNPFSFSENVTANTSYYLDFEVYNSGIATGLLVDNLSATISPEPSAGVLTLAGLALLAGGIYRRRQFRIRS